MRKYQHEQVDPLLVLPLDVNNLAWHWWWIQENREIFDDYTTWTWEEFVAHMLHPDVVALEIGPSVGICSLFFDGLNAWIYMVMHDWRYRAEACIRCCAIAFDHGAERVTSTINEDRDRIKNLVFMLGFHREGVLRNALLRVDGSIKSVELWGLLRKDFVYGGDSSRSSGNGSKCGNAGILSESGGSIGP